jgi:hypothetical protein
MKNRIKNERSYTKNKSKELENRREKERGSII